MNPFPLKIYFENLAITQRELIVGAKEDGTDAHIPYDKLNVHHFLLGKTGSGKTYFLYLYLMNFLVRGKRFWLVDPLGSIYDLLEQGVAYFTREYYGTKRFDWFKREVLDKVVFMDLSSEDHPFRLNLLAPIGNETLSQTINRVIKFFDAALAPKDSPGEGLDLQKQRRQGLVSLATVFVVTGTAMGECKKFVYDEDFRETLLAQSEQKAKTFDLSTLKMVSEAVDYWRFVKETFRGNSYGQLVLSLLTALAPFFESPVVYNALMTGETNVDWQDLFRNKTCLVKLPINDLATRRILMSFIYSGVAFSLISNRRVNEVTDNFYLASDESGVIFDATYADVITRSRNKKVFFISAMQSRKQHSRQFSECLSTSSAISLLIFDRSNKSTKLLQFTCIFTLFLFQTFFLLLTFFLHDKLFGVNYHVLYEIRDKILVFFYMIFPASVILIFFFLSR